MLQFDGRACGRVGVKKEHPFPNLGILWVKKNNKMSNNKTVNCCLCLAIILVRGGNTTNLFSHLKNRHAEEYTSIKNGRKRSNQQRRGKQMTLGKVVERSQSYTYGGQRWKEICYLLYG